MMATGLETRTRALLNSTSLPHSGDWLNVLPSPSLGLTLPSQEFIMVAKYRLGIPAYDVATPCPMDGCTQPNDIYGNHAITSHFQMGDGFAIMIASEMPSTRQRPILAFNHNGR
jgi:hypothetical protein